MKVVLISELQSRGFNSGDWNAATAIGLSHLINATYRDLKVKTPRGVAVPADFADAYYKYKAAKKTLDVIVENNRAILKAQKTKKRNAPKNKDSNNE